MEATRLNNEVPYPRQVKERPQPKFTRALLGLKARGVWSTHLPIILGLTAVLSYVYYGILTEYHDIYVILFFYPLLYAAISYRMWGAVIGYIAFLLILLPHALVISDGSEELVRLLLMAAFGLPFSALIASQLDHQEREREAYEEVVYLNQELNHYIERLKTTQNQLIQAEKMNALGQLSAAIAHEINNPLAGALVYTKLLSKKADSGSLDKDQALTNLAKIDTAVTHCSTLVKGLLDFSRQTEPVLKPVMVSSIIDQVLILTEHQAQMKRIELAREEISPSPVVMADSRQMQQVFINLVVNAIQAMKEGDKLTLRTSVADDGHVMIAVQDTGCGIPSENMDKIFTPFFSTKEEVKGVGLGLSVSLGIVERHGGRIEVRSEVGKGSTFTVHLPAHREGTQSL